MAKRTTYAQRWLQQTVLTYSSAAARHPLQQQLQVLNPHFPCTERHGCTATVGKYILHVYSEAHCTGSGGF